MAIKFVQRCDFVTPALEAQRGGILIFRRLAAVSAIAALVSVQWAHAADPTDKCHANKLKAAAKYASCRLKAESKAVLMPGSLDFRGCTETFSGKFNGLEMRAGAGVCPTEGDEATIDAQITDHATDLALLLSGGSIPPCDPLPAPMQIPASGQIASYGAGDDGAIRAGATLQYVDNGDGTITDANTGLMWEKKVLSTTGGYTPCDDEAGTCGNPHHADNAYAWSANRYPGSSYDGKAVTIFLQQLNMRCDGNATVSCTVDADCGMWGGVCGFAGYRDWRLPNKKELESIVDAEANAPAVNPAFHGANCGGACADVRDPACSCTTPSSYWSSTTVSGYPGDAWKVEFGRGDVGVLAKDFPMHARAVRGGS